MQIKGPVCRNARIKRHHCWRDNKAGVAAAAFGRRRHFSVAKHLKVQNSGITVFIRVFPFKTSSYWTSKSKAALCFCCPWTLFCVFTWAPSDSFSSSTLQRCSSSSSSALSCWLLSYSTCSSCSSTFRVSHCKMQRGQIQSLVAQNWTAIVSRQSATCCRCCCSWCSCCLCSLRANAAFAFAAALAAADVLFQTDDRIDNGKAHRCMSVPPGQTEFSF